MSLYDSRIPSRLESGTAGDSSELTPIAKAVEAVLRDDHVVENPDPDQLAGPAEPLGDLPIFAARGRIAARVIVDEHERGGRTSDRGTKHLARMHETGGQGAL